MAKETIMVNRAPVLTLWAAVVAEYLGYERDAALTMGKAVAGLNAQSKGRMLGIYGPPKSVEKGKPPKRAGLGEVFWVEVCGRGVPAKNTPEGIRAVVKDKPIDPASVERYIEGKFGEHLADVTRAFMALARSFKPHELEKYAYKLYEKFRPEIPSGKRGWGAKGELDLELVGSLKAKT